MSLDKKLIYNVLFSNNRITKTPNIDFGKINSYEIYLRNSFVSLVSAKKNNSNCEVVLFTNIPIGKEYMNMFHKNGINNIIIPFDEYIFPDSFKWSFAFYKLCVLKKIVRSNKYDLIIGLDVDTIVLTSLEDLFIEAKETQQVMLYDLNRKSNHNVMKSINRDFETLFNNKGFLRQYGGEFICGNIKALNPFVNSLDTIYRKIEKNYFKSIDNNCGDEALISFAAEFQKNKIRISNAYIERFWTGRFYQNSTKWKLDAVSIWHLPAEKKYGMLMIFNYYKKHNKFPNINKMARFCSLPRTSAKNSCMLVKKIFDKL